MVGHDTNLAASTVQDRSPHPIECLQPRSTAKVAQQQGGSLVSTDFDTWDRIGKLPRPEGQFWVEDGEQGWDHPQKG